MNSTVTFDGAPPPGTINLGIGQPSADLLPVDLLRTASAAFFDSAQPFDLNYGVREGDGRFIESLTGLLTEEYGVAATADSLLVTGGNSQALDWVSTVFASPGDTVFVEEPTYFLAHRIFRDHGLNIVGIPIDGDGLCVDALERQLASTTPAFLYTIPSYHNPGGQCTTEARRRQIIELAQMHDFRIVADEVYQFLFYADQPPPAYGALNTGNCILSLGSFSKILAPGIRLGWIQTSDALRNKLLASGLLNSGGCINPLGAHIARHAIDLGLLRSHINRLKSAYRARVEAMDEALHDAFGGLAEWHRPDGGYFFWLRFPESVDTTHIRKIALEHRTGFQPGTAFSCRGGLRNYLRLCFAHYNEDDIREAIARLRPLFD